MGRGTHIGHIGIEDDDSTHERENRPSTNPGRQTSMPPYWACNKCHEYLFRESCADGAGDVVGALTALLDCVSR